MDQYTYSHLRACGKLLGKKGSTHFIQSNFARSISP